MTFSEQDYNTLSAYAENFNTAVNGRYSRPLSEHSIDTIHQIYFRTTHDKGMERINKGCGRCILSLLRACGQLYLKDREERGLQPIETQKRVIMNKGRQSRTKSR